MYSIADEYSEYGVTLRPSVREAEEAGVARVNEFFKAGKIKVFRNLKNARHEFGSCKWKPVKPGAEPSNLPEQVQDFDNHQVDNLRYLIVSRFAGSPKPEEKPVEGSLPWYDKHIDHVKQQNEKGKGLW